MSTAEQNILEVIELGGIPRMLKLISSSEKIARCYAMICLCVMAPCGESGEHCKIFTYTLLSAYLAAVRHLLYKSDCIPALLKLLQPEGMCTMG